MNRVLYHSTRNFVRLLFWAAIGAFLGWFLPTAAIWTSKNWGSSLYVFIPVVVGFLALLSYKLGQSDTVVEELRNGRVYDKLRDDTGNGDPYV